MTVEYAVPAPPAPHVDVEGIEQKFPVRRIFCIGRNYKAHAAEMGIDFDKASSQPFYFLKSSDHLVDSGATVAYPPGTADYHHEIELVVAIGKKGFEVSESEASALIFGYACGLDMTRRDLQFQARDNSWPWDLSKNFEQSAVVSAIVPKSKTGVIESGRIELKVNGETRQSSDVSHLIWNVAEIIADLSRYYHLQEGDLIFTGTPAGVSPVVPGDELRGSIEGVGAIFLTIGDAQRQGI